VQHFLIFVFSCVTFVKQLMVSKMRITIRRHTRSRNELDVDIHCSAILFIDHIIYERVIYKDNNSMHSLLPIVQSILTI